MRSTSPPANRARKTPVTSPRLFGIRPAPLEGTARSEQAGSPERGSFSRARAEQPRSACPRGPCYGLYVTAQQGPCRGGGDLLAGLVTPGKAVEGPLARQL